eukprot:Polyplicarium_translucidae@DN3345_c5_g3_i6.p3
MKVALATFSDKPIPPFGYRVSMDYCYWLHCTGEDYPSLAQVATTVSMIGQGPTSVAFAVPPYLTAEYSAIALQWGAAGVPTQVYPHADAIVAAQDAVGGMADPCGATGAGRRLEDLQASLIRGLASPPTAAKTDPQPPI